MKKYLTIQDHFYEEGDMNVSLLEIKEKGKKEEEDLSVSINDEKYQSAVQYCEKWTGTPGKSSNCDPGIREN